jgi:uncharacterized protein YdhG (YjbR/CyaY superfamily)
MKKYTLVSEFLEDLSDDKKAQVQALRDIIIVEPGLTEHIKWNAPSYVLDGEDRITFNLRNKEEAVKLILHMGVTRREDKKAKPILDDTSGLVTWSSDIRGILSFNSLDDIESKKDSITEVIKQWLALKP